MPKPRDRSRRTEGSLLLFVFVILVTGAMLVYLAKTRAGLPSDAVNLNTAGADELAVTLELDPALAQRLVRQRERLGGFESVQQAARVSLFVSPDERQHAAAAIAGGLDVNAADWQALARALDLRRPVAERIVAWRAERPGGRFRTPGALLRTPIVDDRTVAALGPRLYVRSPATVFWRFLVFGGVTFALFLLAAVLIRKAGVGGDPYLLPIVLLLGGLGVLGLFSAKDPLRDAPFYLHHLTGMWMGLAALVAGALLPGRTRRGLRHYTYLWALGGMALLFALMLFGTGPEGVRLNLGFFQPVEVIKLLLVLFIAGYLTERGDLLAEALHRWRPPLPRGWGRRFGIALPRWQDMGPMALMYLAGLALFLVVRDMGPALLLFGAFVCTLYVATGRGGIVWIGLLLIVAGGALAYRVHIGVLPTRVDMWLSPWSNAHANGMQLGQALWGMASGGEEGSGLGLGATGTMPVVDSDLAFAGLAEELGLIGALCILALFVVLIWRGMRIALHTQNDFDRLLAVGLTTLFACQVFLIVAGVTGLLPLTGITLPFIAHGNTSLVADFLLIGLLRGVSAPSASVPIGAQKPLFRRAVRRFATVAAALILGVVGLDLFIVQAAAADWVAGHTIRTPDADRVVRAKVNPRLLAVEKAVPRGSIYDRQGRVLATSRLDEMSQALDGQADRARHLYQRGLRYYPYGPMFAHLVGYVDPALGGPAGLEKEYNDALRGFSSYSELLDDYRNRNSLRPPHRRGRDLALTVDAELQETVYRTLKQRVATLTDARTGRPKDRAAMVMLDPATGAALAAVSLPSFDPNGLTPEKWERLKADADGSHRLLDRARFGFYPPGSTLKVATAAAGLEAGLDPLVFCDHTLRNVRWSYHGRTYARREISDDVHDRVGHRDIRMARALRVSCNVFFATLGVQLDTERLYHAFADRDRWALSHVKPIDRFAADLPLNAIGQGTMTTSALEMARVAAAVADRGTMMRPYFVAEVREPGGATVTKTEAREMSRPLSPENAAKLGAMMRDVVQQGTASGVFDGIPAAVAGKTGTAQTDQGDRQPHSWFTGFAPYERPQYAFACVIENGGYGKQGAAPVVRDVLAQMFGR